MRRFSKVFFAMGIGLLVVALASVSNRRAAATAPTPTPVPVTVTNTPLPIQGTVGAAQSGSWSVGLAGTPTVNLGAGNTVGIDGSITVGNPASSPVPVRDVENPARQPFQAQLCQTSVSGNCGIYPDQFIVPAGEELTIEYVSGWCFENSASEILEFSLSTTAGGQLSYHFFNSPLGALNSSGFTFGQAARIYADPSSDVFFSVSTDVGSTLTCRLGLSGYTTTL